MPLPALRLMLPDVLIVRLASALFTLVMLLLACRVKSVFVAVWVRTVLAEPRVTLPAYVCNPVVVTPPPLMAIVPVVLVLGVTPSVDKAEPPPTAPLRVTEPEPVPKLMASGCEVPVVSTMKFLFVTVATSSHLAMPVLYHICIAVPLLSGWLGVQLL